MDENENAKDHMSKRFWIVDDVCACVCVLALVFG